ncbi:hypothetical protein EYZ11_000573 [Aspergillus tanneri]|uniref:UBC core domain-containing protein n=1 Tax=Aspergillus tanneri TaxID=1220188 RepID=A0A4S3JWX0_9EURO|nr:hypothetical protein EYZ11_000573 [Aspergillus tanneri]
MKEASELTTSPSPHFCAHPVDDTNLYDWHFTLAGPPAPSPYADGIYHGRIVLPATYPLRPPSFRFLTPSGRFEVNREICLSISGHHEETWQPAWGIRTALIALRSFMDGDAKGQLGGLDVSDEIRRDYARRSRGWCCDVCVGDGGGKSNEEVLNKWRETCRLKGVSLDDENDQNDENKDEKLNDDQPEVQSEVLPQVEPDSIPTSEQVSDNRQQLPVSPIESSTQTSALSPSQTPTPTPTPTSHPDLPMQRSYDPWLDRAIVGVLVALVIMILRRIANAE